MSMLPRLARTLAIIVALAALGILASAPSALAYGRADQWQAGFSGTCSNNPSCGLGPNMHGATGFWGWCAFGGSNGSAAIGTTGTTADCQITSYFGSGSSFHVSYNVTAWVIQPGSPFSGGLPDFLFTSGTLTLSGPGAASTGFPSHVPIPFPFGPPINGCPAFICDSGIPAIPGHFSFHPFPGSTFELQVTKVP
jgi:hypothetical protein